MSKFPKADTTEAALSAVEEALKIDFKGDGKGNKDTPAGRKPGKIATNLSQTARPATPAENGDAAQDRGRSGAERKAQERARARRAGRLTRRSGRHCSSP